MKAFLILVALVTSSAFSAEAPMLSDISRLQLKVTVQRIEIAQLRAQAAQAEFDRAREDLTRLLASVAKDGYDVDLQRFEYVVRKPDAP